MSDTTHKRTRQTSGRYVRVRCSCGWTGRWRWSGAYLLTKQLHSDDGEHLHAIRRQEA